ncbi:MAG: hypothetical protein AB1758_13780 [Candidatus Eremiobacterota bacterium]
MTESHPTVEALKARLRGLPTDEPPESLRAAVVGALQADRRKARVRWLGAWAALLMVGLGLVWWLAPPSEPRLFVEDHRHMVASGLADIRTGDRARLEAFFTARLGFGARLPAWAWAQPVSGRLCRIRSRMVARVQYRSGAHDLSLFVRPARTGGKAALQEHRLQGFQVLSWADSGLEFVLVVPQAMEGVRELVR